MKLHIGCGDVIIPEYTNVDIRYMPGVDVIDNAAYLRRFKDEEVTEIYACHILEHFCRWDVTVILKRWFDILTPCGKLVLAVPDFEAIVEFYTQTGNIEAVKGLLYGGQDYSENMHHNCWDFASIKRVLLDVGFETVARYDWKTESIFSTFDDFSKCYLPHMDFDNGKLMSLNVTASKCIESEICHG